MYSTWSHKVVTLASTLGGGANHIVHVTEKTFPQFCKRLKMMTAQNNINQNILFQVTAVQCLTLSQGEEGGHLKVFPKLKHSSHLTNTCMGIICPERTPTSLGENKLTLHLVYWASTFRTGAAHTENEHHYLDCVPKTMTVLGLRHLVLWADSASSIILLLCKKTENVLSQMPMVTSWTQIQGYCLSNNTILKYSCTAWQKDSGYDSRVVHDQMGISSIEWFWVTSS